MSSIRDKYKATSTKALKEIVDSENLLLKTGGGSDFLTLEDGLNKMRVYPKHEGEESYSIIYGRHWLTIDKEGEDKRVTVPNSKLHAGTDMDIIDEYIKFCQITLDANDANDAAKLKSLVAYQGGINMQTVWLSYAKKINKSGKDEFGVWEIKRSVRDGMNEQAIIEDESEAMDLDPFSGADDGKPVLVTYNSKAKKPKDYYKVQLSKNASPLSDEEIEAFDKILPLSKLPFLQYSIETFETALEGLQWFDDTHEIGLFESDTFQAIIEEVKEQYDIPAGGTKTETKKTATKPDTKKVVKKVTAPIEEEAEEDLPEEQQEEAPEEDEPDEYENMARPELIKTLRSLDPEVKIYKTTEDDVIRQQIRDIVNAEDNGEEPEPEEETVKEVKKPTTAAASGSKARLSLNDIKAKLGKK